MFKIKNYDLKIAEVEEENPSDDETMGFRKDDE